MAQLPQIQYRQVSIPKGPGPGQAIARANQIAKGTEVLTKGLAGIAEAKRDYDVTKASVGVGHTVSNWERSNAGREVYTAQEVKDAGLDNQVNMIGGYDPEGNPIYKDVIPAHEVNTFMLEKVTNDAIAAQGSTLSPMTAKAWTSDMNVKRDAVLLGSAKVNTAKAVQWRAKEREVDIATLQSDRDFAGAAALINAGYMSPGAKREAHRINFVLSKQSEITDKLTRATTVEDYDAILLGITPEWADGLTADETIKMMSSITTMRNQSVTLRKSQQAESEDVALGAVLVRMTTENMSIEELTAMQPALGSNFNTALASFRNLNVTQGVISDPAIRTNMSLEISALRGGVTNLDPDPSVQGESGETSYSGAVQSLRHKIITAATPTMDSAGNRVPPQLDTRTMQALMGELEGIEGDQFNTPQYNNMLDRLHLEIKGYDRGGIASALGNDTKNKDYSDAKLGLDRFADRYGIEADFDSWYQQNAVKYMNSESVIGRMNISKGATGLVAVDQNNQIDLDASKQKLATQYENAMSMNPTWTQTQRDAKRVEMNALFQEIVDYANNPKQ